jgi:hypothetical protein
MNAWADLVSAALLGTERREPPALDNGDIGALAATGTAEERLLTAAGALAVYGRAGRVAVPAPPLPEPARAETAAVCPRSAAGEVLFRGDPSALLPAWAHTNGLRSEWLDAVARRDLGPPPELLPHLLDFATPTHNEQLRPGIEAVLGERGRWLAAQEPSWAWAAPLPDGEAERDAVWATGDRLQRRRLFVRVRSEDPARARELLERSWGEEEAEDRQWFVEALGDGLTSADEALLERALDDRRLPVRYAAAALLSRLPGSAFAQRMRERALAHVRVEGGVRRRLHVVLPEAFDEALARDAISRKPPRGMGERTFWLVQIVQLTPLSVWNEVAIAPEDAATLRANDGLEVPLRQAFARATELQRDPVWAAAFLEFEPHLAAFVDVELAAPVVLARLAKGETETAELLPAPWPRALSEQALELLVEVVRRRGNFLVRSVLARRLDPTLADEAVRRFEGLEPGSAAARDAEEILAVLTFRRDMYEELR